MSLKTDNDKMHTLLLGITTVLLLLLRNPYLVLSPRLWAEEGGTYLPFALSHHWIEVLLSPHLGYFSLVNNIVVSLIPIIGLEYAPLATTLSGFLAIIVCIILVLKYESIYWNNWHKKWFICLTLILTTSHEIFANLITIQFYLTTAVFIIMLLDWKNLKGKSLLFVYIILIIAALSSPQACFLFPLFLIRYFFYQREKFGIVVIYTLFSLVQSLVVIYAILGNELVYSRFDTGNWNMGIVFYNIVRNGLIMPFSADLYDQFFYNKNRIYLIITAIWGALPSTALGLCILKDKNFFTGRIVPLAFLTLIILTALSAIEMNYSGRYTYPGIVVLFIMLLYYATNSNLTVFFKKLLHKILIISLALHILLYFNWNKGWPDWSTELKKMEQVTGYNPKIWPEGWVLKIH